MSSPMDPRHGGSMPPAGGPPGHAASVPPAGSVPGGTGAYDPAAPVTHSGAVEAMDESDLSYQRYRQEDRSLGEIASELMDNATTLIKQEVELAKVEAKQAAKKAGAGAGLFAAAAAAGLMVLVALTLAMWWAFAILIGTVDEPALGISGVIVAVIWAVIAAILAFAGKSQFDKMQGLDQTQETVQKIPNAATGHEERNR